MSDSIRDALTKAFEDAETPSTTPDVDTTPDLDTSSSAPDTVDTTPDAASDNAGADSASAPAGATPAPAAAPAPSSPPPASWNKAEREAWASLSPVAQEAVKRRETELNRILQTSAEARRSAEEANSIFAPYDELIQHFGATRTQAAQSALATMAALYTGTEQQKAELIANAVFQHGVPVETLAQLLHQRLQASGGIQPQAYQQPAQPAQPDIGKLVQEAMTSHPMFQQYAQRQEQQAVEAITAVEGLTHFDEVRLEMADVLDRARSRGKSVDLYTAYEIACRTYGLLPDPSPTAQTQQQARDEAGRFAAAKRAASSVSGSPKPTAGYKPGSGSIREELLNVMNKR